MRSQTRVTQWYTKNDETMNLWTFDRDGQQVWSIDDFIQVRPEFNYNISLMIQVKVINSLKHMNLTVVR
jgi:hypothetical protein